MRFEISAKSGAARRGRLTFARGVVDTPAFMPVGTYGTVKAVTPEELEELGSQIILGNTFHLLLRPGVEVVQAHGGDLHAALDGSSPFRRPDAALTARGRSWALHDGIADWGGVKMFKASGRQAGVDTFPGGPY